MALAKKLFSAGHKVGVLDLDVSGPNDHYLLDAVDLKPGTDGGLVVAPTTPCGVRLMTIGYFLRDKYALTWEEQRKEGIVEQLLRFVDWGDAEYLVVDFPPGTEGVTRRCVAFLQEREDGFIIVTTPRIEGVRDAQRSIHALEFLGGKVCGCILNMSGFRCGCGLYHPFGDRVLVDELGLDVLCDIPLLLGGEPVEDFIDLDRVLRATKPKLFRRR